MAQQVASPGARAYHHAQIQDPRLSVHLQQQLTTGTRPASVQSSNTSIASSDTSRYHNALNTHAAEALRRLRNGEIPAASPGAQRIEGEQAEGESAEQGWSMRHGFTAQHSAEQLQQLSANFYMYYGEKRHETGGVPQSTVFEQPAPPDWRMRDRLKTVSAILAMCLNIGVEPPSGFKTLPAAKLQCWIDPSGSVPGGNAMGIVTRQLQTQYEQLSMRTRYKVISDPTMEEIKKYAQTVRRNAREERILFHYNGNGVPEVTKAGELWFFNKNYTQYIPVSLFDLQQWLGAPTIFVYDVSLAGKVVKMFDRFPEKHLAALNEARRTDPSAQPWNFAECIQLAACGEDEYLPTNPLLPADLFTSCLTTPIEMAVRFYILQSPLKKDLQLDDHYRIPGRPQERKTPLGELNWIFTAITDTIAWNMLPRPLFKRLFRQDLMVAALFRNFLLAQRVMRTYHCHPQCQPPIPDTHNHPLWASWDLAIEMVLAQLQFPDMQEAIEQKDEKRIEQIYQHSDFFKDQLTAFEVYLDHGAREQKEPEQLPIVLQVLLSQVHRLRALILLSRFLDLGPWAVRLALGIGIFPYVLKLLQSQAQDLKPPLIFIWARILAVDQSCQADLLKDNGFTYFASILNPVQGLPVRSISEHRAMCAFIIAIFCRKHRLGQQAAQNADLVESCLSYVSFNEENNPALRQWACLCLSTLWEDFSEPKWTAIRLNGHVTLCDLVSDPVPEVRAAMLHAMSTFIGVQDMTEEVQEIEEEIAMRLLAAAKDSCVIVRKELAVFLSAFCGRYMQKIIVTAIEHVRDELHPTLTQLQQEAQSQGQSNDDVPGQRPINNNNNVPDEGSHPIVGSTSTGGTHVAFEDSSSTSFATARGHNMSGTTFDSVVTRNSGEYGSENGQRQTFSKDSPYMAVWMHVLMLAIDPDIQVARGASYIIRTVILTAMKMPDFGDFTEDLLSVYGEHMTAGDSPSAPTTQAHHPPQTPAPAPVPTTPTTEAAKADGYLSIGIRRTASVAASLATMAFRSSSALSAVGDSVSPPKSLPRSNTLGRQSTLAGKSFGDLGKINDEGDREGRYGRADFPYPKWYTKEQAIWPSALPIRSDFFEYATEYFQELRMMNTEEEEPGSRIYNERMWRRNRNEDILDETQRLKDKASKSRWDQQAGYFNNGFQPGVMCFHQYENQIVIADDCDMIRVWDWARQKPITRFSNGNPTGTRVTELRLINEDDQALLMTGSSDGSIKIFKDYDTRNHTTILTSFSALPRPDAHSTDFSLTMDWLQTRGEILTAGDSKSIRVWSALTELLSNEIRTLSSARVTSITSDQVQGDYICAGFADGTVRIYDQRVDRMKALVRTWREHEQPIIKVHMQRGGLRELVSCSSDGVVKHWDATQEASIHTLRTTKDRATSVSVHEHAPVVAVGTSRHKLRVFNTDGACLSTFEPLAALRGQTRTSPISTIAFHPHKMMLAAASTNDYFVSLYSIGGSSGGSGSSSR